MLESTMYGTSPRKKHNDYDVVYVTGTICTIMRNGTHGSMNAAFLI